MVNSREEFVNIRVYRSDRNRLAATMKYGETMADKIRALIEQVERRRC